MFGGRADKALTHGVDERKGNQSNSPANQGLRPNCGPPSALPGLKPVSVSGEICVGNPLVHEGGGGKSTTNGRKSDNEDVTNQQGLDYANVFCDSTVR